MRWKVLIACEYSGIVRDAFQRRGHYAMSCDLLPTESPGLHYEGPVEDVIGLGWDLMVAHPPCTHLANSGARWFKYKEQEQQEALAFVQMLLDAPIRRVALENPAGVISTRIRPPTQVVYPYQFGHPERKRTCLWLKGLPPLKPTTDLKHQAAATIHQMPQNFDRGKKRSLTYRGIAEAMAEQWTVKTLEDILR